MTGKWSSEHEVYIRFKWYGLNKAVYLQARPGVEDEWVDVSSTAFDEGEFAPFCDHIAALTGMTPVCVAHCIKG